MLYSNINGRKRITLVKLPMLYDIGKSGNGNEGVAGSRATDHAFSDGRRAMRL